MALESISTLSQRLKMQTPTKMTWPASYRLIVFRIRNLLYVSYLLLTNVFFFRVRSTQSSVAFNTSSGEVARKQTVLNSIAEKMQMQEKVDPGINEQLAKMINQLMLKREKPEEGKLKEKDLLTVIC